VLSVAGVLIALVIGFWLYQHWQEAHEESEQVTDEEVLAEFEEAYFSGEMTEDEYRRVTALLKKPGGAARLTTSRPVRPPAHPAEPPLEAPPAAPGDDLPPPGSP